MISTSSMAPRARCLGPRSRPQRHVIVAVRKAGPDTPAPDYTEIDKKPLNAVIMQLFRNKLVQFTGGVDSKLPGYAGVIDLTRKLHRIGSSPRDTQVRTRQVLQSLFPAFLPPLFARLISKPFPQFSAWMNAWATWLTYVQTNTQPLSSPSPCETCRHQSPQVLQHPSRSKRTTDASG